MNQHLDEQCQCASYQRFRNNETAVQNDIPTAVDANDSFTLVLLELSLAFETVEHVVLLLEFSWENAQG